MTFFSVGMWLMYDPLFGDSRVDRMCSIIFAVDMSYAVNQSQFQHPH